MATPLQKFRAQYPDGTLTAELISINEGQYVVRAAIGQAGKEIATGLAASVDVQIAEDKARDRALAVLNIVADSTSIKNAHVKGAPVKDASVKAVSIEGSSVAEAPIAEAPIAEVPVAEAPAEDTPQTPQISNSAHTPKQPDLEPTDIEEDLGPPIDAVLEEPLLEPEIEVPSASAIALENFSTSTSPVDLSDVIAQTDIELRRLGWDSSQGREYLDKTYRKRSRQQLTDEELMSFLLYLEEQP